MKNLADIVVLQETPYPAKNEYKRTFKIIGGKLQFFHDDNLFVPRLLSVFIRAFKTEFEIHE